MHQSASNDGICADDALHSGRHMERRWALKRTNAHNFANVPFGRGRIEREGVGWRPVAVSPLRRGFAAGALPFVGVQRNNAWPILM